jgi:hypothetical protein
VEGDLAVKPGEVLYLEVGGEGSVIATVTPVNKMVGAFKLNFSGSGGIQNPKVSKAGNPELRPRVPKAGPASRRDEAENQ